MTDRIETREFNRGRCFLGRLPHGQDLVKAIELFCERQGIRTAVFSVIGSVSEITLGSYDQKQQVYVTFRRDEALEIIYCTGNISMKEGRPTVHAHGIFADVDGHATAGHVFPETIIFAGEIYLRELLGEPLIREYDTTTGLALWKDLGPSD